MADELTELRQEVASLRQDLDHVLRMIGQEESLPEQPRPEFLLLEAEVIHIRQNNDNIPMVIKAHDGRASIFLNDNEGRARGVFQLDEDGCARFEIWNKDQQVVVSIGETAEGAGEIYVAAADGKPRAGLKVLPVGGIVTAQNSQGQPNALLVGKDEGGTVVVADAGGKAVAEISATDGNGIVRVKDPAGRNLAWISGETNGGVVAIFRPKGENAARLASEETGGTLVLFDDLGNPKTTLPGKLSSLRGLVSGKKREADEE